MHDSVLMKFVDNLPEWIKMILRRVLYAYYRFFGRPYKAIESSKARGRRLKESFFTSYCRGRGLDIGYGGDLLTPTCTGWDIEHGDAQLLAGVPDESYDFVYSSHTLEDMNNQILSLRNWWRVLMPSGYMILYVPHRDLFEKKRELPSRWNINHKCYFLLDRDEAPDTKSILGLVQKSLTGYELVYAKECTDGHMITDPERHSDGEYSIEVVLKKLPEV